MKSNLSLRKVNLKTDIEELFDIMINGKDQMLFHGRVQFNYLADFERWFTDNLSRYYHDFYVVYDDANKKIAGYVYSYEYRSYDGHCKVFTVLTETYRQVGMGALVGLRFLKELFTNYPIRKVYLDIYNYNKQSLMSNLDAGFKEEGCLKNFRYDNGEYHDMHILSLTRETFYEKYRGIIDEL